MKYLIAVFCLLAGPAAFSQQWHPANKKLKQEKDTTGYYSTVAYSNAYDTIPCIYFTNRATHPRKGFKFVYVYNGDCIDDARTFRVFYDENLRRVHHVRRYAFD